MNFKTGIFAILAIFCLILSTGAICAEEFDGGYAGMNYDDGNQYQVDEQGIAAGGDVNESESEPGAGLPLENQSAPLPDNATNSTNSTNSTNATNTTHAAGGDNNPLSAIAQTLHATGNPILILLVVVAVLGGVYFYRRN